MRPPLREVIARHGLATRKSLGQHFLLDGHLLERIVRCAGDLDGVNVLEIGPGPGGLTRALLDSAAASVTAIEIDPRAVAATSELLADHGDRLRIVAADALELALETIVPPPRAIVANLPYNAGTAMLIRWLHQAGEFRSLTLMFQQEVAERIIARPDTPHYGRLAVLAALTTTGAIALNVPAAAFSPPPKVESAVVRLIPHASQPSPARLATIGRITAAAFGQRRKMLRGALKSLGGAALLEQTGIDPQRRAETLTPADYVALAEALERRETPGGVRE
ncbi:16S rRNA (adenine(1518)-N(6)/adenine(1519)-N(6))-dimethyltransferase RsmA [Acidiphilium acidophilum]|uniref:16S rRNA (adenine(1518)-N(6)/adenine(1519)-N(6))- dimethyltransferase RsmA n=1 Tax=Acidiphilium acidophilum TaxID=76588 RepID=UPI002E8E7238|nr:16S rRNA (adenine(1518)-N(6)/adenine(1519)-N(6))-dimethyltransferase RsmA [Acidiphilium acidophilum]